LDDDEEVEKKQDGNKHKKFWDKDEDRGRDFTSPDSKERQR